MYRDKSNLKSKKIDCVKTKKAWKVRAKRRREEKTWKTRNSRVSIKKMQIREKKHKI